MTVWGLRFEAVVEIPGTFFLESLVTYCLLLRLVYVHYRHSSVVFRFELIFNPVHDHRMTDLWIMDQAGNADIRKFKIWCLPSIAEYFRLPEGSGKPLEAERER